MKGRTVTTEQRRFHDMLARHIGCIACRAHGIFNDFVSIHHIDGRTKPDAHWLVLPLCGPHHQDDGSGVLAIHPWKRRFIAQYGRERVLLAECVQALLDMAVWVPIEALRVAGIQARATA